MLIKHFEDYWQGNVLAKIMSVVAIIVVGALAG